MLWYGLCHKQETEEEIDRWYKAYKTPTLLLLWDMPISVESPMILLQFNESSVHSTLGFLIFFFFQKSKAVTIFWTGQFIVHWPIHLYQPGYVGCKAVSRKYQSESTGNEIAFKNQWGCQAIFCFFVFFIPGLISRQKYLEKTFVALLLLRMSLGGSFGWMHKVDT